MDCKKIEEFFTAYADGDLGNEDALVFDEHLQNCQNCSGEWVYFNKTIQHLKTLQPLTAPADLLPGIHAKLDRQGSLSSLWKRWRNFDFSMSWQTAVATIAIAFTSMAVIKTFHVTPQHDQLANPQQQIAQYHQPRTKSPNQNLEHFKLPSDTLFGRRKSTGSFFNYASNGLNKNRLTKQAHGDSFYESYTNIPRTNNTAHLYRPDINISDVALSPGRKNILYNRLMAENSWHAQLYDTELLIFIRPNQLSRLQTVFAQHKVDFSAAATQTKNFDPHKPLITVAIQLD